MWEWIGSHKGLFAAVSVLTFVGTLVLIPILVVRIPADYFVHTRRESAFAKSHPIVRITFLILKNGLGVVLLLAGLVMSLPLVVGQGVLTMLIGISLLDVPGKRRLELAIIRREPVHRSMNWIRHKAGRPPLELPPKSPTHAA
ncbi:MAG: hypothetical protein U0992_00790 [Planctomycetaceae bacterium]